LPMALKSTSNNKSDNNKSDFATRLNEYSKDLLKFSQSQKSTYPPKNLEIWGNPCLNLINAIEWLADEASHHASIDTFAKKLYFKKDTTNLKKLKVTLSAYLISEQQKNPVDFRYDSFFASICEFDDDNHICLPPNLRILTWNYDTQLEKAFYGFCEDKELVLKKITYNRDQIRRINGCCGHEYPNANENYLSSIWDNKTYPEAWALAIDFYDKYMNPNCQDIPDISFAWEKETYTLSSIIKDLDKISVLIVIGYSFPYFNRNIDDKIFKNMGHLDKVYLQCPPETYDSVKSRLDRLLPPHGEIIKRTDVDLFCIPDDL